MKAQHIQANEWTVTLFGETIYLRFLKFGKPYNRKQTFCGARWVEVLSAAKWI